MLISSVLSVFGASEPGTWSEIQKLEGSFPTEGDRFGHSLSIDGDIVAVGAPYENGRGRVYVYIRSGNSWYRDAELTPNDAEQNDQFGWSVSVYGESILVGANGGDSRGTKRGKAYIFTRTNGIWTQEAVLTAGDEAEYKGFGGSVSLTADTAVVGAERDPGYLGSYNSRGSVYIYHKSDGIWYQEEKLEPSSLDSFDQFGSSVSIEDDMLIIGAEGFDGNGGANGGGLFVYRLIDGVWIQKPIEYASDRASNDEYGHSVNMDGNIAVVGAYGNDDNGSSSGSAYVLIFVNGGWSEIAKLLANDGEAGDYFGYSVSVYGDTIMVGAYGDDDNGSESGSVYIFTEIDGVWSQQAKIYPEDGEQNQYFGRSVANRGNVYVAGSYSEAAYVFDFQSSPAPYDLELSSDTILEGLQSGTSIGFISAEDPNDSTGFVFDLVAGEGDVDNALFSVGGASDDELVSAGVFNYETQSSYSIRLRVTDADGNSYEEAFVIYVENVEESPVADAGSSIQLLDQDGDGFEPVILDGSASFDPEGLIESYEWTWEGGSITGVNPLLNLPVGNTLITLTVTDASGLTSSDTVWVYIDAQPIPKLNHGIVSIVSGEWQTVTLPDTYDSMVVVATPIYEGATLPLVARVRNALGNTFEVKLQNPSGAVVAAPQRVSYFVVEEGVYDSVNYGFSLEAHKVELSTASNKYVGWNNQLSVGYSNTYSSPVVLGQVMTENDAAFSVFFSDGGVVGNVPNSTDLRIGYHTGEDSLTTRAPETVGYVVLNSGFSDINGVYLQAGVSTDSVLGYGNNQPDFLEIELDAENVVTSSAAMDGADGGWPVLSGNDGAAIYPASVVIDEDQISDSERSHTTEQVAFVAFGDPGYGPADPKFRQANIFVSDDWQLVTLPESYESMIVLGTPIYGDASIPAVVRVRNIGLDSFEIRVQNPSGSLIGDIPVSIVVVEEGVYTVEQHGFKAEARNITIDSASGKFGGWNHTKALSYRNSYNAPVVLGQVTTNNNDAYSAFFATGSNQSSPPSSSVLKVGFQIGEDLDTNRVSEAASILILESGLLSLGDYQLFSGLSADILRGYNNSVESIPFSGELAEVSGALLASSGMDGADGGWPIVYGLSGLTSSGIQVVIDEDQINDTERSHTTEQVAFVGVDSSFADFDLDGLTNSLEETLGLDPTKPDSDGNGIVDLEEDSDGDSLTNSWELALGYDLSNPDTDGNGTPDNEEDADADGLPNDWEIWNWMDPQYALDATEDFEPDGLDNLLEFYLGTDPNSEFSYDEVGNPVYDISRDDDGDYLTTEWEIILGYDALSSDTDGNGIPDNEEDADADGLPNDWEIWNWMDPLYALDATEDFEPDGLDNLLEFYLGTDPNSEFSYDEFGNPVYDISRDDDGDYLTTEWEIILGYDALSSDTDGNGIPDNEEDADADGLPNDWEIWNWMDPLYALDATEDFEPDGLDNLLEFYLGTDPNSEFSYDEVGNPVYDISRDDDGDYLTTEWEIILGYDALSSDTDGNGIPDNEEDADADGLPNDWEIWNWMDPLYALDATEDFEPDGLDNLLEFYLGTDPNSEFSYDEFGNPVYDISRDDDGDYLTTEWEIILGYDALSSDTDGNGIPDNEEDADADGLPNDWEIWNWMDPLYALDATEDFEPDGLDNLLEFYLGTDPNSEFSYDEFGNPVYDISRDDDGDYLTTEWEIILGYDPLNYDSDGDGIFDDLEDEDADGVSNIDEILAGTDPLDELSF
ncbi:MAG: hypothetical protein ACPGN3_03050 [Opitutales bacterium]